MDFGNFIGAAAANDNALMRNRLLDMQLQEAMAGINVGSEDAQNRAIELSKAAMLDNAYQPPMTQVPNQLLQVPSQGSPNVPNQLQQTQAPAFAAQGAPMPQRTPQQIQQLMQPQQNFGGLMGQPQPQMNQLQMPGLNAQRTPGQLPQMNQVQNPQFMQPQPAQPAPTPQPQTAPEQSAEQKAAPSPAPKSNAIDDVRQHMEPEQIRDTFKEVTNAPLTKEAKKISENTDNLELKKNVAAFARSYQEIEIYDKGIQTIAEKIKSGSNNKFELVAWSKKLDEIEAKKTKGIETYQANGAKFISAALPVILENNDKETLASMQKMFSNDKYLADTPMSALINTMKIRGPVTTLNVPVSDVTTNVPPELKQWASEHPQEKVKISFRDGKFQGMEPVDPKYFKSTPVIKDFVIDDKGTIEKRALTPGGNPADPNDWVALSEGKKPSGANGGKGMTGFIQSKLIPGAMFSRADGKTYVDTAEGRKPLDTLSVQEQAKYWTPQLQKLKQQGGMKAVTAYVAADTYKSEAKELLDLRNKLLEKNPGVFSGVGSKLRKVNDITQWTKLNTSDDPDLAEFIKGTTLLADVLMNAVGGAQGGQWAFELASKLLDPTMPTNAYEATINKHLRTLETKAGSYNNVGQIPGSAGYQVKPKLPGEKITGAQPAQPTSYKMWAKAVRDANPGKTLTDADLYDDYKKKYGSK